MLDKAMSWEHILNHTELALARLDALYKRNLELRYGQIFLNIMDLKNPWPSLYYEQDAVRARQIIKEWLIHNQCPDRLDRAIDKIRAENTNYR